MVDVKNIYKGIFIVICILFIGVLLFGPKKNNNPFNTNDGVELAFNGFDTIDSLDDESYMLAKPNNISLKNTTDNIKEYNLYYVFDKRSNANYKSITIILDDKVYHLNDLGYTEDYNDYYFLLDNNMLEANQELNITSRIYTTDTDGYITSSFVIL